jgi:hypothetical protein|tara:strand:- start:3086 stop:3586 length:501 start_codon:yes stop_codon:yes gene_type:complete
MTDKSSQNLSGAKKSTSKAGMLTVVQRYVSKYGIREGVKRYKQDGWKQKKASKKVRMQVSNTKSGPRRISEGTVGIGKAKKSGGRSQLYKDGDRVGAWTPSGGQTASNANRGQSWFTDRGYGVPSKPVPDTPLARKLGIAGAMNLKVTGQTYVKSQDWEYAPGHDE